MWRVTVRNTAFSLVFLLAVGTSAQAAMYRWVDSAGHVHYGDTLPAEYQKNGAAEMNKQGQIIKRTASETERKLEAENRAEQARAKLAADERARLDHALTATYTTENEIDLARDRALEHHRLVIKGAEIRAKVVEATLNALYARADKINKANRKLPANLVQDISQSEEESQELKRVVQSNQDSLISVRAKYDADKLRFRELVSKAPR